MVEKKEKKTITEVDMKDSRGDEIKETVVQDETVQDESAEKSSEKKSKSDESKTKEATSEFTDNHNGEKKPGANRNALALTLSGIAVVLSGASAALSLVNYQQIATPLTLHGSGTDGNSANFTEGSIADVAERVSESVVSIVTSTKTTSLFGGSYTSQAAGTGIIVSADGYILTNRHVVDGASEVTVVLDDGTTYEEVEVVVVDPSNDVAFLKIADVDNLKAATLGDSKTISVGQQVIAIGNALGQYQNTVTSGIVSGTGRSLTASDSNGSNSELLSDMIQTDAAINSGNSGGPLVNAAGEVIGINTATSSTAENMGFAIPISSVKGMLDQLTESGNAKRAYLGVYSLAITPAYAKEYNLPVTSGAYLYNSAAYSAIIKGSPAEKAGLKDKDIITAINGVKIGNAGTLSSLIGEYKPGDTIQLTVIRSGKEMAVNVTLGEYTK